MCGSIVFASSFFFPADVVLSAFRNLSQEHPNATVPPGKLQEFLSLYFEPPGTEFESWTHQTGMTSEIQSLEGLYHYSDLFIVLG